MIEIISARRRVEDVRYERQFQYKADSYFNGYDFTDGYAFPVDKKGNPLPMSEAALKNFNSIKTDERYIDLGINEVRRSSTEPAIGKCLCGAHVVLDGSYLGASECGKCGRWYGMNGQEFTHPSQWEKDY